MTERFTKEQMDLCRKIDRLRRELGEGWRPRAGDWLLYHNRLYLCYGFYKDKAGWRICFRRPDNFSVVHDYSYPNKVREFTPILSWADCRALLRKMGWQLRQHYEGYDGISVLITIWKLIDAKTVELKSLGGDDLTAIMQVILEVLERLVRQSEGGGGKVKEQADE